MSIFRASSYRSFNSIDSTQADSRPRIHVFTLIYSVLIPLIVGSFSALLTMGDMRVYETLTRPPLSPPGWMFSVVWTVLYVLMGLASYFVWTAFANPIRKMIAMRFYVVQLLMNFLWPILFFTYSLYLLSFVWLLTMWDMILICMVKFYKIRKVAGVFMGIVLAWTTFAAYLNCAYLIL